MSNPIVTISGSKVSVVSEYHPDFPKLARAIGGKWAAPAWVFDARDESRVRALCVRIYGSDGSPVDAADLLTIRAPICVCDGGGYDLAYYLAGRKVASARGRDSGARLGDGVILIAGKFSSGGSMKNPRIEASSSTIVEVRDVPRAAAEKVYAEYHGVTLLDATGAVVAEATVEPVEIIEPVAASAPAASDESAAIDLELAAAQGRLAGLQFRAAELRAVV